MTTKRLAIRILAAVGTLLLAVATFQVGNGFLSTVVSLRVDAESWSPQVVGVVLASYYAGYTVGALRAAPLIRRIGHIRAFAAFAGAAGATVLAMPLLINAWSWTVARLVIGFCGAGLFITVESWLNAKATRHTRGQVFALYMVALYAAMAFGQLLVGPVDLGTDVAFNIVAFLFAVALVVVATAHAEPPRLSIGQPLPVARFLHDAPVAIAGCAISSMAGGIFYTLGPVWAAGEGHSESEIGRFLFVAILGGLCLQPLVGRLSDKVDRRLVVAGLSLGLALMLVLVQELPHHSAPWLLADFLMGGFLFSIYPVCVVHAVDRIGPDLSLEIAGRLVLITGVASALGPIVGSQAVAMLGMEGFIFSLAVLPGILTVVVFLRFFADRPGVAEKQRFRLLSEQVPIPKDVDAGTRGDDA